MKHTANFLFANNYLTLYKDKLKILKLPLKKLLFQNYKIQFYVQKFFNIYFKNGLKFKNKLVATDYFFELFCLLFKNSSNSLTLKNEFFYAYELKSTLTSNSFLFNIQILTNWYLNYFFFLFNTKKKSNVLKSKSKQESNIEYKLNYINKHNRNLIFFKWLRFELIQNNQLKIKTKFNFIMFDLFLNFKRSKIYLYKMFIYKKILNF